MSYSLLLESASKIDNFLANSKKAFESVMIDAKKLMYQSKWDTMKNIRIEDYLLTTTRKRYVHARNELEKAKQAVQSGQWEEVLNHLRSSIDLSLKERFGFSKIQPMKQFLRDAERFNLPLPSYTMLYDYFDEGSQRIHEGKLNTPFECQKALEFVAGFIKRLELVSISQIEIEDFKKKSKAVE